MSNKNKISQPELFFNGSLGAYLMRVGASFMQLDKREIELHLRVSGLSKDAFVGSLNELEQAFYIAQTERCVDYSGALAGHNAGTFETGDGRRILVTKSPRLTSPKRGKWPSLEKFFESLLGGEQDYFFAWAKSGFESLAKGDFRPGQMLALAGEAGCGKSLCQLLVTEIFGGRVAKPYKYMTGATAFNGDLAKAEHWCIEDEHGSTDIRIRRQFGTAIKDVCANLNLSVHDKGKQAITLPTFRRITLSVNSESENLQIIPPLDSSLSDKIMLLRCNQAEVGNDRAATWKRFMSELPAFVWFLLNEFEIPKSLRSNRYGVVAYQNRELADELTAMSPEHRMLNLIDEVFFTMENRRDWTADVKGSTEQIERWLRGSQFGSAVDKLLYFSTACGVYLARLEKQCPKRVTSSRKNGKVAWTVMKPE